MKYSNELIEICLHDLKYKIKIGFHEIQRRHAPSAAKYPLLMKVADLPKRISCIIYI